MTTSVLMIAPAGSNIGGQIGGCPSGTVYVPNALGEIVALQQDVQTLIGLGFVTSLSGLTPGPVYNTNAATTSATLTAANITGSNDVTLAMTGTSSGAANAQLPTVAALVAALPNPQVGQSWRLRLLNLNSDADGWTLTTNTGWTLRGAASVAQNGFADYAITLTDVTSGSTAATLQYLG